MAILSRRDRQRLATLDEIVTLSREILSEGGELSVRALATRMGIASPGLYRYVESADALTGLVAGAILRDVIGQMGHVKQEYADDPPAQLAATTAHFRRWALDNVAEFQLIFATPRVATPNGSRIPVALQDEGLNYPSGILSSFFGEIFTSLIMAGRITAPTTADLPAETTAVMLDGLTDDERHFVTLIGDRGPGTLWVLKLAWTRLYGVLTMEVFGQIERRIIDSGLVFAEIMKETFISLGMNDDWDRLLRIARNVHDRADAPA